MWKHTKMIVLVALCAAIYAAVLIPFKGFVLIPGITELRPGVAFPIVFGLLFGPAGAWGAALGNLISDFFGTLGPGSLFGFIGNFFFAYVPYKLWQRFGLIKKDDPEPLDMKSANKVINFILVALLGSLACALIIAWSVEFFRIVPFAALATIISLNNFLVSVILGPPLMLILYPRIKKWGLLWTDILSDGELPRNTHMARVGAAVMVVGIVGGMVVGLTLALGTAGQAVFAAGFAGGTIGSASVVTATGLGVVLTIIGGLLQR